MYSLKAIFDKEPAAIAAAVRSVLWLLVLLQVIVLQDAQLGAIGLTLEFLLLLFVRGSSTSTAAPKLTPGTTVTVATPSGRDDLELVLPGVESTVAATKVAGGSG